MQDMRYYNCLVKLGGDPILMQAPRLHISEDEVRVLRHIHGEDAITQLSQIDTQQVDRATHLYQIARYYNDKKMVEELFRVSLDNFEAWLADALVAEEQDREQRFQIAQIERSNRRAATITEAANLAAPEGTQARGADPGANDTTGVAAAAKKLEESVAAAASQGIQTGRKPPVKATVGAERQRESVE